MQKNKHPGAVSTVLPDASLLLPPLPLADTGGSCRIPWLQVPASSDGNSLSSA